MGRPTPATALAFVALFAALTAGAYAGSQLPRNSVGTKQLKNGAVKTSKIADGAVKGAKVADDSISESHLANGAAVAKAFGRISYNANDVNPTPTLVSGSSRNINSVTEATSEGAPQNGVVCIDVAVPFSVANVTGNDEAGAASPAVFASVNYSPSSGTISCPAGSDLRVTTYDKLNTPPVAASFSLVLH